MKRINNLWCFFDRPACYAGKREVKCSRSRFPRRKINAKIYIADELYEAVEKANPGDGKQEQYDIYQNLYFHPKLILSILEMWNTWSRVSWGGCSVPWTNIWGTWTTADTRWSSIQTSHFWGASIQYSARYCVYEPMSHDAVPPMWRWVPPTWTDTLGRLGSSGPGLWTVTETSSGPSPSSRRWTGCPHTGDTPYTSDCSSGAVHVPRESPLCKP